jgi:hypothetical protein
MSYKGGFSRYSAMTSPSTKTHTPTTSAATNAAVPQRQVAIKVAQFIGNDIKFLSALSTRYYTPSSSITPSSSSSKAFHSGKMLTLPALPTKHNITTDAVTTTTAAVVTADINTTTSATTASNIEEEEETSCLVPPVAVTEEFLRELRALSVLCPHRHIVGLEGK